MQHTVLAALKSKLIYLLEKHMCKELISSTTVEKGTCPVFIGILSIDWMQGLFGTTEKFCDVPDVIMSILKI